MGAAVERDSRGVTHLKVSINKACISVPRMSALFFHRPPIYERATDHTYTKGCGHLGKKCGWDQM